MTDHPGRVLIVLLMAATLATLLLALSPDGGASRQGYALMATGTQNYGPYSDRQVLPAGSWAVPCPTPPPYGGYGFPGKSSYVDKPVVPSSYWAMPCSDASARQLKVLHPGHSAVREHLQPRAVSYRRGWEHDLGLRQQRHEPERSPHHWSPLPLYR